MAGHTPSGKDPVVVTDQPIVIDSPVHGEVDDWNPQRPTAPGRAEAPVVLALPPDAPSGGDVSPPPPEVAGVAPKRAFSLDALRGLFLVLMTAGFTVGGDHFPAWMYHRQQPGNGAVVDIPGISWRDLAYASFLFTMAAALPLTLSRRIAKGELEIGIIVSAIKRYGVLLFFAMMVAHSNTFFLGYTQPARLIAILGFAIMAMVFTRRRPDWDESRYRMINRAGWVLAIAFLALTPLTYGKTFEFTRIDDVIVGLAFASLFGSVIWYFTRENLTARLAILAAAVALYLGAKGDGWVSGWWWDSAAPWLYAPKRFILLAVVIPGTIAGDILLRWMNSRPDADAGEAWSRARMIGIVALCTAFTPLVTLGMYHRQVGLTTQLVGAMIIGGAFLTWAPRRANERMLQSLFIWAAGWLMIGLFLEPFEGGIRKLPDTLSYFFTVTGTTSMLLVALTALLDGLGRQKWVNTLIDIGHNPLLMYVIYTVFLNSLLELIPPLRGLLRGSFGEQLLRSAIQVAIVMLMVRAMSRRRIYWRT